MKNKTLETILDGQFSSIRFGGCKQEFFDTYLAALAEYPEALKELIDYLKEQKYNLFVSELEPFLPQDKTWDQATEKDWIERVKREFNMEMRTFKLGRRKNVDGWEHDAWTVTLFNYETGAFMDMTYNMGIGHEGKKPEIRDILFTIRIEDPQGEYFPDWCNNFGYSDDSIKARDIYDQCVKQTLEFRRTFPDVDLQAWAVLDDY